MKEKEKYDYLINKGFYATQSGEVISFTGKSLDNLTKEGYYRFSAVIENKNLKFLNHRFVYYYFNRIIPKQIDHINGIQNDNRLENLRSVTNQQNQFNKKTAKGYSWHKSGKKFRAQIGLNKKTIHLGYFETEQQAREAYQNAKKIYHII